MFRYLSVILCLVLCSCVTLIELTQSNIQKNIIGEWEWEPRGKRSHASERIVFNSDFTGQYSSRGGSIVFWTDFEYSIEENKISIVVDETLAGYGFKEGVINVPQYTVVSQTKNRIKVVSSENENKTQIFIRKAL